MIFPHITINGDYNSLDTKRAAVGAGQGVNLSHWFCGDYYYAAPHYFIEFSLQYRLKVEGDERATGVFTPATQLR